MIKDIIALLFLSALVCSCMSGGSGSEGVEIAMSPGMEINFNDGEREMIVRSQGECERCYVIDGCTNKVKLKPLRVRYYGNKGLSGSFSWKGDGSINRAVISEGQQHFYSQDEAEFWLNYGWNGDSGVGLKYTNNGLAVGYKKTPSREQINIDVWQIYINGEKPKSLKGASSNAIRILYNRTHAHSESTVSSFVPSNPSIINGIEYSGRVLDILKERGDISISDIEKAIRTGKKQKYQHAVVYELMRPSGYGYIVRAVVGEDGRVMLVY